MSIWSDTLQQAGYGGTYQNLSPQEALQRWYQNQAQMAAAGFKPGQQAPNGEILGSMETLARENPEAFRLRAQGTAPVKNPETGKNERQVFNPQTGQFDTEQTHGWFSHPESWLQLGLGAAAGVAAPAAIASGAPAATTP